ncbi:MAG: metallophosphoesterase [Bacteroidales bacterium]|nr:metallophosphoesterase [Bacteroidales bacterium]
MLKIFIAFFPLLATQSTGFMNTRANAEPEQKIISIGLIADVQYCDCETIGTRFFSNSLEKLSLAIDDFNHSDIDFIMNLGDLIDRDYESYGPVMDILEKSNKEIYHILGNHDLSIKPRYKKKARKILTGDSSYYSFTRKAYRFIALNTCEISTYYGKSRSAHKAMNYLRKLSREGYPNPFKWNGAMGKKQIAWFRSELERARENQEKVIVFSHHTIQPEGSHNIYNREEMLDILAAYDNIIAWFSAHDHKGGYDNSGNIHFVTMKGMVETREDNAWAVLEIYPDKLWLKGSGREISRILAY